MNDVTIFHNPHCSKSRQTLQLLLDSGIHPEIIDYLQNPPSFALLEEILAKLGWQPRQLMRTQEPEYQQLGLDNPQLSREALINGMVNCPKLIERPIVLANGKAAIGRPPEAVLAILTA